ncbi:hypothetical protein [Povalibacter sp.]|uniref:globin domain-containing protein n=1 Tax=Povalibacter sp. TaxID=1962978 RepID=UPI002F3F1C51
MKQHLKRLACRPLAIAALAMVLGGCQTGGGSSAGGGSLFQQLGGMNTVMQLASIFLQSSSQDSQLSSLFQGADRSALTGQIANQLCASLGGGCAAPLTSAQITAGARELTGAQTQAISKNLNSALATAVASPLAREAASQMVSPQISGILGALL